MKKLFWVGLGIGIGMLAAQQWAKARSTSPLKATDSVLDRISSIVEGASGAFKEGMSSREAELREALGLDTAPRGRHSDEPRS